MLFCAKSGNASLGVKSLLTAVAIAIASAAPVSAQDSRVEEIAARQREKAGKLAPYKPSNLTDYLDGTQLKTSVTIAD